MRKGKRTNFRTGASTITSNHTITRSITTNTTISMWHRPSRLKSQHLLVSLTAKHLYLFLIATRHPMCASSLLATSMWGLKSGTSCSTRATKLTSWRHASSCTHSKMLTSKEHPLQTRCACGPLQIRLLTLSTNRHARCSALDFKPALHPSCRHSLFNNNTNNKNR